MCITAILLLTCLSPLPIGFLLLSIATPYCYCLCPCSRVAATAGYYYCVTKTLIIAIAYCYCVKGSCYRTRLLHCCSQDSSSPRTSISELCSGVSLDSGYDHLWIGLQNPDESNNSEECTRQCYLFANLICSEGMRGFSRFTQGAPSLMVSLRTPGVPEANRYSKTRNFLRVQGCTPLPWGEVPRLQLQER